MRAQCMICNEWSRELIEVPSEYGKSLPYYVHAHEAVALKARVKDLRAQLKVAKAAEIARYGQRYHH